MPIEAERPDVGSSITIVFSPSCKAVIVGFSRDERIYKFPCGKVEWTDIPKVNSPEYLDLAETLYGNRSHEEVIRAVASGKQLDYRLAEQTNESTPEYAALLAKIARKCALRELECETAIVEKELEYVGQLGYTRPIYKQGRLLRQFSFFGIQRRQDELGHNCVESTEMADPEYWDPIDVLRWDVPQEQKFNPFHRIVLAKCLVELRDKGITQILPQFEELLDRAKEAGFDIDGYEKLLRDKISAKEI